MRMPFPKVSRTRRVLAVAAFLVCCTQGAQAQYADEDSNVEDWQLYDEEETDTTPKPRHREWANIAYVRYSPSQYTFPGHTPHLHFHEVAAGWARSLQVADSIPLFVEAGAEMKCSFSKGGKAHDNAAYTLLSFKVPVAVAYKFYLSRTRNIAIVPLAGVNFRVIAVGKEKSSGVKVDLCDKDKDNHTGTRWDRCQLGWQAGLRLQVERCLITASYGRDFPDKSKCPQIHECGVAIGVCF